MKKEKRQEKKTPVKAEAVPGVRTGIDYVALLKDWRVAILIILLVLAVISINPHFENGEFTTSLPLGLDLQKGAWLQLEFKAEVAGFETAKPVDEFIGNVKNLTDTEVVQVSENKLEIRKPFTRDELGQIFTSAGGTLITYEQGVSKVTADQAKVILESKINSLGTKDAKVNTITSLSGISRYMRVEMAGVSMTQAQEIVGKQGKFEIRIYTTGNETEHVLFGDAITTVGVPTSEPRTNTWGVPFTLSDAGANAFRQACIQAGAVTDPENHELAMLLDENVVYSAPLSAELAGELQTMVVRQLSASTGQGTSGLNAAKNLEIHLRAGALPVDVTVAASGATTPASAESSRFAVVIAGIAALIAVGLVIYYRYREPSIVLPMVLINASEIVILLGISRFVWELDLASIAGLIAVLGTGIDQMVVITDEVLHEGKVPSPSLYKKRLARALMIIVAAAATVFIAMVPLAVMPLGTLRGFAIVTILGVLVGVIITRPAYGRIIMEILAK
ncbi:MAG: preprotein translocase subunit SecD [Methanoregulaceae archaeon]|nr:preprotein translocase subunit SecD [Methanoregulaceae archaeon]